MLTFEKLREILVTWKDDILNVGLFNREIYPKIREEFLKPVPLVLHGLRRSGKTYLMYRLLQEFPESVYINFEDERFAGAGSEILDELYGAYIGTWSPQRPAMLLDEVQNIAGWEKFVARLYSKVKFVVSGSNATLLSSEYSTALTGRHIPIRVFPLSFAEYVNAKTGADLNPMITGQRSKLRTLLVDYIDYGSFPEASLLKDKLLLKSTFDAIIFRDVIPRYDVRNPLALEALARYLVSNPGKPFSYRRLIPVTSVKHEDTLNNYVKYLEKAYLITNLSKFDYSIRKQAVNQKKSYPADTSFARFSGSLFSEERGRLLETIVCNHLARKEKNLFYWKDERNREVDFVVCEGLKPVSIIQVAAHVDGDRVWKRETDALKIAGEVLNVSDLTLLVHEIRNVPEVKNIRVMSVLDWLIEKS